MSNNVSRDTISKIQTVGHYRTNTLVSLVSKLKEKNRDSTVNLYIKINLRYIEANAIYGPHLNAESVKNVVPFMRQLGI